jgi:hypothetical protein
LLTISVFVAQDPPQGEDAQALRVVQAVAARFPETVGVELLSITGERAEKLGLRLSPTVVEGDMVLSVGEPLSAGRLKRYIEARLTENRTEEFSSSRDSR